MSSSESEAEIRSVLERLISSRNRDLSLFIPFLIGFTNPPSDHTHSHDHPSTRDDGDDDDDDDDDDDNHAQRRDRIVLINPLTQGMVVIEGTRMDTLFRTPEKAGQPPAAKAAIESMPEVEIKEGEDGECVICLEEWVVGERTKEMPCGHRFHGGCIEKWLGMHGSCPLCRHVLPTEEAEKKEEERGRREIWVSFSFGGARRRTEGVNGANGNGDGNEDGN